MQNQSNSLITFETQLKTALVDQNLNHLDEKGLSGKGRTIRKVMGGGGGGEKTKNKFLQGKMPRKKIRAKKKVKEKKFMQKEGPILGFYMTSRPPCWCPQTMKWRPCWCPDPILRELTAIIMLTSSFVFVEKHGC